MLLPTQDTIKVTCIFTGGAVLLHLHFGRSKTMKNLKLRISDIISPNIILNAFQNYLTNGKKFSLGYAATSPAFPVPKALVTRIYDLDEPTSKTKKTI